MIIEELEKENCELKANNKVLEAENEKMKNENYILRNQLIRISKYCNDINNSIKCK